MKTRRRWAAVLLPGLLLAAPVGCSSGPHDPPYREVVQTADRRATSDFERQVFADGQVTAAEYEEAVDRYVRCANDRGVQVTKLRQPAGYYGYTYSETLGADGILSACAQGTTVLIEPIYVAMVTNPQRSDIDELIAACVVRTGLAPAGFTGAALKAEKAAATRQKRSVNLPFDEDDPRWSACVGDPLHASRSAGSNAATP